MSRLHPSALREHVPLLAVLGAGLLLRLAMLVSFPPAFVSSEDALTYMALAWRSPFVGVVPDRPSGYAMFIELTSVFGHSAAAIVAVQHLLGLATGALAYLVLVRHGVRRWLATAVAAVLVLDAYALTMEHWVLSESVATFAITAAVCLTAVSGRRLAPLALAGGLLAYAVTVRTASIFVVPVWLGYLLWTRRELRPLVAGAVPLLVVGLGYMSWHHQVAGSFAFSDMNGWFLYARVGKIGTCGGASVPAEVRPMCPLMYGASPEPRVLLWGGAASPAQRVFGGPTTDGLRADPILRRYALAIIRDRPLTYTRMVGRDVLRYFDPSDDSETGILALSDLPVPVPATHREVQQTLMPGYRPHQRFAAGLLDDWSRVVHVPRPLLGLLAGLGAAFTTVAVVAGRRLALPHRREAFLFLGGGLALVVGATATSAFILRYMLPALPLLAVGVAFALEDAVGLAIRAPRSRASRP